MLGLKDVINDNEGNGFEIGIWVSHTNEIFQSFIYDKNCHYFKSNGAMKQKCYVMSKI